MTAERTGEAAIAYNIIVFVGTILLGAFLIIILGDAHTQLLGFADTYTTTANGNTGLGYVKDYWSALPWFIMVVGLLQLLGAVAFKSARGDRL